MLTPCTQYVTATTSMSEKIVILSQKRPLLLNLPSLMFLFSYHSSDNMVGLDMGKLPFFNPTLKDLRL